MKKICPICGKESEDNEKFCKECGAELNTELQDSDIRKNNIDELESNITNPKTLDSKNGYSNLKNNNINYIDSAEDNNSNYNTADDKVANSNNYSSGKENNEKNLESVNDKLNFNNNMTDENKTTYKEEIQDNRDITNIENQIKRDSEDDLVDEILKKEKESENGEIYPIHSIEDNPYAESDIFDFKAEKEFINKSRPKKKNRIPIKKPKINRLNKHHFRHLNKHGIIILFALVIIAIIATLTFNIIEDNTINYINPTNDGNNQFSNKIITFNIPLNWEKYNSTNPQSNVIGEFKSQKDGHNILLSIYQSKLSNRNIDEIRRSTEELDIRSGALINKSTTENIDNITAYDVTSKNGTNNYEYRTFGFIKDNKEYAFLFVSDDIDYFNNDIDYIIKTIKFQNDLDNKFQIN